MSLKQELKGLDGSEIAIIGMAGRFPGARSIDEYWANIRGAVESLAEITGAAIGGDLLDRIFSRHCIGK